MTPHNSAKRTQALAVFGAIFFGGLTGWSLAETKSAGWLRADLISLAGALGTWAVGLGAFVYARAAHLLRETELRRINEDQRRAEIGEFNALRGQILAFRLPVLMLDKAKSFSEPSTWVQPQMKEWLNMIEGAFPKENAIAGTGRYAIDATVIKFLTLSLQASAFRVQVDLLAAELSGEIVPVNQFHVEKFEIIELAAIETASAVDELAQMLDEIRAEFIAEAR
ncbi:hypothetical protein [Xanthomonas sp. WHRI 6106]|uniref:hypothetical protein n=1 Tax=Xanthomonas sp. WHRI 6106 TaxID=3161566 RepID=UPI0032E8D8FE